MYPAQKREKKGRREREREREQEGFSAARALILIAERALRSHNARASRGV
jgi:hypothetical protein